MLANEVCENAGPLKKSPIKENRAPTPVLEATHNTPKVDLELLRKTCVFDLRASAGFRPKAPRDSLPDMVRVDCGEDAYYIKHHLGYASMGLSDGVGGWGSLGVDSSLFAWDLMQQCEDVFANAATEATQEPEVVLSPSPQYILEQGYSQVVNRGVVTAGSSTACVVVFQKEEGMLLTTNLGDSGLMVFRQNPVLNGSEASPAPPSNNEDAASLELGSAVGDWEMEGSNGDETKPETPRSSSYDDEQLSNGADEDDGANDSESYIATLPFRPVFSTTERQHYFNAPYQLSVLPPSMASNPNNITDSPSDAVQSNMSLENGDVIVMASDGLWDNMYWEEVVHLLERELGPVKDIVGLINDGFEMPQNAPADASVEAFKSGNDAAEPEHRGVDENQASLPTPTATPHPPESDEGDLGVQGSGNLLKSTGHAEDAQSDACNYGDILDSDGVFAGDDEFSRNVSCRRHSLDLSAIKSPDALLSILDKRVSRVASILTDQAASLARDSRRASPFAKSARANGKFYIGGKVDDITIIVGVVVKLPNYAANSSTLSASFFSPKSASLKDKLPVVPQDDSYAESESSDNVNQPSESHAQSPPATTTAPPPPPATPTVEASDKAESSLDESQGLDILANASLSN